MVLGSDEKGLRSAYICIDDGSIDWEASKQASKRCIVASWISMEIRRWVIQRFFNIMLLKGTVLYDFMAFIRFPRGRLRVWTKAIG